MLSARCRARVSPSAIGGARTSEEASRRVWVYLGRARSLRQGGNTVFGLGYQELLVILVIVLVLFGGSKLPELAKSLGKSVKEFKKGIATEPDEENRSSPREPSTPGTSPA